MEHVLIVDGYNVIGAWPELRSARDRSLDEARDLLIEAVADYQGYTGMRCIVVFDAYNVPGLGRRYTIRKVEVYYTKEKETADECIERLVKQLAHRRRQIYVATSDYTEQYVAFGSGALRLSARELQLKVQQIQREVAEQVRDAPTVQRNTFDNRLDRDVRERLEQWRKGQ